jgi:hypothetical protein
LLPSSEGIVNKWLSGILSEKHALITQNVDRKKHQIIEDKRLISVDNSMLKTLRIGQVLPKIVCWKLYHYNK